MFKSRRPEFEINQLMDLYWGGPERRITRLTLRIIGINAAALVILLIGILYLGQYQRSVVEARLETFSAEVELIAAAIAEGAIETDYDIVQPKARRMIGRLSLATGQRILLFDRNGDLVIDSQGLKEDGLIHITRADPPLRPRHSVETLKSLAAFVLKLVPEKRVLPSYPDGDSLRAEDYPNVRDAMQQQISLSAWRNGERGILLTAAAPVFKDGVFAGAMQIRREGTDIEKEVIRVWISLINAFGVTLVVTVLLSIYLSGVIARPLRRLASAAEAVRRGKSRSTEIPDLSHRHDEIGELSIVLREMTQALWDRMDSIENFAADVAHELKNPLTSLRSALETAEIVKTAEDREKLLNIAKHDVRRMERLISDISSASRLDSELSRESFAPVSLRGVLCGLVAARQDSLQRSGTAQDGWDIAAQSNGVAIVLSSAVQEDILVWGLEGRLAQVFENLISNAVSFSPSGGAVQIHAVPLHRMAMITIEDQGPGIPENRLETIFERFYSERPEHEDYGQHSGLGLSICRQIVTALGGQIHAENIHDDAQKVIGARFTVILNRA